MRGGRPPARRRGRVSSAVLGPGRALRLPAPGLSAARAQTKGKDERNVGYVKEHFFVRSRSFDSWAQFNQLAEQWLPGERQVSEVFEDEHPRVGELLEDAFQAVLVTARTSRPIKASSVRNSTECAASTAYSGEAEHRDRLIVNAPIGDRDRSGATLAGWSAVELALLSP